MWVKCRPDSKNANCIEEKGPVIDLDKYPDTPKRLPQSAVQDMWVKRLQFQRDYDLKHSIHSYMVLIFLVYKDSESMEILLIVWIQITFVPQNISIGL